MPTSILISEPSITWKLTVVGDAEALLELDVVTELWLKELVADVDSIDEIPADELACTPPITFSCIPML